MDAALEAMRDRVRAAAADGTALCVRGGGTKDFYGNALRGEILDTRGYAGIVRYEPTELVFTARGGTPLAELEAVLAAQGQLLPFEPPHFGAAATLGGCIAAGLSGPRRANAGAVRDFVLGLRLLDGAGRVLGFGGEVMKNVAGYDLSRLVTGSLGTLGIVLEASVKVLPRPVAECTLRFELDEARAIETINGWSGQPVPISASAWRDGGLSVRLSGAAAAVDAACARLGGERVVPEAAQAFWHGVREHTDPFFGGDRPLWRLSVPSNGAPLRLPGEQLIEWHGAQRWLRSDADAATLRSAAGRAGGHATLVRAAHKPAGAFTALTPVHLRLHRGLKAVFDPAGVLNPGRLYAEL